MHIQRVVEGNRKSIQIGEQPTNEKEFRPVRGLKVQNWAK
jgi:hypothetical protein